MLTNLPDEGPLAFFAIQIVFTFISLAIRICHHSVTVHLAIYPAAVVNAPVLPPELSCAVYIVLFEVARVAIAITPDVSTMALL